MGHAAEKHVFTAAEYLLWEADPLERHEFVEGDAVRLASVALEVSAAQLFAEVPEVTPL
jgi:hypothetical protein